MNKTKQFFSSPLRIIIVTVCIVGLLALGAFWATSAGASLNSRGIGLEKATVIALEDAGYAESEVSALRGHYDSDDGFALYEIEFVGGNYEYDYEISASDGTIIQVSKESIRTGEVETEAGSSETGTGSSDGTASTEGQTGQGSSGASSSTATSYIGNDKAKTIALESAGVASSAATFTEVKLDRDDGVYVYDVEFISGDFEYSFEIDATTGAILDKDVDSIYD